MDRGRPEAARHGGARRVRHRAEDRRPGRQPDVRGRRVRPGGDARRQHPGRGRDAESPHDSRDPAPHAGRPPARRRRGARRGVSASVGLPRAERAARRDEPEARTESPQRCGRLGAAEELERSRPIGRSRSGSTAPATQTASASPASTRCSSGYGTAASRRTPLPSDWSRSRTSPQRCRSWEAPPRRARLRDRRDRDQGRLTRSAAAARRAPWPAALGTRIQVGADDRPDEAAEDPHSGRSHRRPQSLGRPRARRGRRRHGFPCDAPQRGGHQPQADSRGRHRHRPTSGRRHSADRRPGRRPSAGYQEIPDAEEVPALRAPKSSSPKARSCTDARTAPAPRGGSRR